MKEFLYKQNEQLNLQNSFPLQLKIYLFVSGPSGAGEILQLLSFLSVSENVVPKKYL